ncbi:hypothetical protein MFRU_004g03040 [Monilinia fructicola]|uniref:Uncharacterized protein n=1 Tax=Monilinia fructicola TaxID=38448 RepID=A0A5M9JJV0_MONFR|nr:hypothetical protein EYC84_001169 [Monilinia fructicola]KAG4033801.1 hypothetical protein MFRU_004g03040 [Monilinia fructicola]
MFFGKNAVACLLTLAGLSAATPSPSDTLNERDTTAATVSGLGIYAYGSDINGQPVFYSDGNAYIGSVAPPGAGESVNITFSTTDPTSTTSVWSISANTTSDNGTLPFPNNSLSFYIVPTNGSFERAGFGSSNTTLPTGSVTEGFVLYGKQIAYKTSAGELELQFWAAATNATGVWGLYWNSAGSAIDGAFPVVLKTTAPPVLKVKA